MPAAQAHSAAPVRLVDAAGAPAQRRGAPFHSWQSPRGVVKADFYRAEDSYLVHVPGVAEFEIPPHSREVVARREHGTDADAVANVFTQQIVPLALSARGHTILHASAIEVDGAAVAFVAASGRGKSTLAASFALAGHALVTDDSLELAIEGRRVWVACGRPSLRLWPDSSRHLLGEEVPAGKLRVAADERVPCFTGRLPLRAVFALQDGAAPAVAIGRATWADAVIHLVRNTFLLDVAGPRVTPQFDTLSAVASSVPVHALDYPRSFDELPKVRAAILEAVR